MTAAGLVLETLGILGVIGWAIVGYRRVRSALSKPPPAFKQERQVHSSEGQRSLAQLQQEIDRLKGAAFNEVNRAMADFHGQRQSDLREALSGSRAANLAVIVSGAFLLLGSILQLLAAI